MSAPRRREFGRRLHANRIRFNPPQFKLPADSACQNLPPSVFRESSFVMDVELLIMKVKENSAIFDTSDKNHYSRNFIAAAWSKISEEMGIPGDKLKEKWHQLRSNYKRAKRYEKNKPSSGAKSRTKWPYYELMSFLTDFQNQGVPSSDNVQQLPHHSGLVVGGFEVRKIETKDLESEELTTEAVHAGNNSTPTSAQSLIAKSTEGNKKTFERRKEASIIDNIDLQYLAELINASRPDENDSDRMFLLSLLPSMKKLTTADNIDFKLNALHFLKSKLNPTSDPNLLNPQPAGVVHHNHQ